GGSVARVLFVGRACCDKRVMVGSSTDSTGTPTTEHQSVQSSGTAAVVILPILPDRDRFGALTTIGASSGPVRIDHQDHSSHPTIERTAATSAARWLAMQIGRAHV